jgi:hypothetical protein
MTRINTYNHNGLNPIFSRFAGLYSNFGILVYLHYFSCLNRDSISYQRSPTGAEVDQSGSDRGIGGFGGRGPYNRKISPSKSDSKIRHADET